LAREDSTRVIVIDSSSEIFGDDDTPPPYMGRCRRIQVSDKKEQAFLMNEALINHTPDVVIIDEISTMREVSTAVNMCQRGVRLIATAHADTLPKLLKNRELAGLLGGVATMYLSHEERRRKNKPKKTLLERTMASPFQFVLEVKSRRSGRLWTGVNEAVDALLDDVEPHHLPHHHVRTLDLHSPLALATLPCFEKAAAAGTHVRLRLLARKEVAAAAAAVEKSTGASILECRSLRRYKMGKTTILRDLAATLAREDSRKRVLVIDSSSEICGAGDTPPPYMGRCRRIQVPDKSEQASLMNEALINHTPDVVIIDEISTMREVATAVNMCQRGVRLIATAHADTLPKLLKNRELDGLLGGVGTAYLSHEERRMKNKTKKTVLERTTSSAFEFVLELESRKTGRLWTDVDAAVDALLDDVPVSKLPHHISTLEMSLPLDLSTLPCFEKIPGNSSSTRADEDELPGMRLAQAVATVNPSFGRPKLNPPPPPAGFMPPGGAKVNAAIHSALANPSQEQWKCTTAGCFTRNWPHLTVCRKCLQPKKDLSSRSRSNSDRDKSSPTVPVSAESIEKLFSAKEKPSEGSVESKETLPTTPKEEAEVFHPNKSSSSFSKERMRLGRLLDSVMDD
jgi:stage III sporulation protein SpoIIIAA